MTFSKSMLYHFIRPLSTLVNRSSNPHAKFIMLASGLLLIYS
jgi:hypothetical protein